MVYDQLLFGEGSLIESGKDAILKAILELGETVDDKVAVLMIAMNDPGVHQLVQYFMKIHRRLLLLFLCGLVLKNEFLLEL